MTRLASRQRRLSITSLVLIAIGVIAYVGL